MKRQVFVTLVVVLGVGVTALGTKKFWEGKEFSAWSKKEIKQMLTKSPWARTVTIPSGGIPTPNVNVEGGSGLPKRVAPGSTIGPTIIMTVRWCSALPIKQALAAHRFGSKAQEDEDLKREETHYTIGLTGATEALFSGAGSESEPNPDPWKAITARLKADSILKISGREPIQAVEIQLRNSPDLDVVDAREGGEQPEILVMFRRSQAITLKDKQVEFVTRVDRQKVKRKFKLKDMVYNGELTL